MVKRTNKGFTTYVSTRQHRLHAHSKPFPCNDIRHNRSNGMPCILYLLTAKRLIIQVEHRYVGIGHCNRPGCIQRKMFRQAVHSLSHIVPACTHGITVTAVRQPELRQKSIKTRGAYHECTGKQYPVCQLSTALRVSSLA